MVDIKKDLVKQAQVQRKGLSAFDAVLDVNKLLSEKGQQDYDMLRSMGMHENLRKIDELKGKKKELEALESKYGQIFTLDEIKVIACKYALKFLRSDNFIGTVDAQLPQKIREFATKNEIEMTDMHLQYKFFILAPAKCFRLEDRPVPPPRPERDPDPVIFYQVEEGKFALVHKWGKDFTNLRQIIGWKYTNSVTWWLYWAGKTTLASLILLCVLGSSAWLILPAAAVGILAASIAISNEKEQSANWRMSWRQTHKMLP